MNVSEIIKASAVWYVVLLPVSLIGIVLCGHPIVQALAFVLGALNSFGAA